jgi:molecular chaperone HtpG
MTVDAHKETLGFQAEVKQLLNLMIHSLYSNKEIFLRELVSNASDACDKLRFEALADDALYEGDRELNIRVDFDPEARTVTVTDNGIGMSRQEAMDNLGTIAKSGTRQFFESLTGDQARDAHLIGQFGVGFYSSFIVADRVTVETRRAGLGPEHGVRWESDGAGAYTMETVERAARGTSVTLHLREGEDELLDGWRLRGILGKYSDHITLPILMAKESSGEEGEEGGAETEQVNRATALWALPKADIGEEEYKIFYRHVAHDFEDPLAWTHNRVEGRLEYTSLLYLPARPPFDLWDRDARHGVKLYVQRVFIMDDAEQLMPRYLRFVRGIIDSNDLPLNISREILQGSKVIDSIRAGSVKKVLGLLEELAEKQPEDYARFWTAFGQVLKEGPGEDFANREAIARLLRFASTQTDSPEQTVSLADYLGRMQEGQEHIYYIIADSFAAARNSPHLERLREKGVEVLLLTDRVDEWLMGHLMEFEGKGFRSVTQGDLELDRIAGGGEPAGEEEKAGQEAHKALLERVRKVFGESVREVRVSGRLATSPACLVRGADEMSAHLERMLRAAGQEVPKAKPILELNPSHSLVARLEGTTDEARFEDLARLLFDQAQLADGGQLEDPASFVQRLTRLLLDLPG